MIQGAICMKATKTKPKFKCFICGELVEANNNASALCDVHKQELREIKDARHANEFPEKEDVPGIRLYRMSEIMPRTGGASNGNG